MQLQCHPQTTPRCGQNRRDPEWTADLPPEWRPMAIAPLSFSVHRDYELPASRTIGYDEEMATCFYRHTYVLGELCSDDGEEFYEAIVYGEEVCAWRLRDDRWLVWKITHEHGECRGNRGFYSFSEQMPR